MPNHQLPRLTQDHSVPSIASSGEWDWHSEKVLSDISESLESDVNPQFFDVDSIPDIWARPLLFNMAFCDKDHPLHEKVIGEWRGMMALIGLSEWHGYPLDVQHVDLSALKDGEASDSESAGFAEIAARMAPKATIDGETDWTQLYLFRLDGDPLAVTSPLTLVATAGKYRAHGVGWWNGQVLRDPLGKYGAGSSLEDKLNSQEKGALSQWLTSLKNRLVTNRLEPAGDDLSNASDSWETLLAQLDDFVEDLQEGAAESQFESRPDAFRMSGGGFFSHLDRIPIPPEPDLENSHVLLEADPTFSSPDHPDRLLIIADNIAEQWAMEPQDIIVHGVDTLANVRNEGGRRDRLKGREIKGGEWRRASDLFNDQIGVIKEANAFDENHTERFEGGSYLDVTPVIPIDYELLHYLSAEDLANRVRITGEKGGGYKVEVDLPLSGSGDEPREVTLEREYSQDEVVVTDESPLFGVWPNFEASDWSHYYSFYSGAGRFYLEAFPEPQSDDILREKLRHGEIRRSVALTKHFPSAALCFDVSGDDYLGFVAIRPPGEASSTSADAWTVGVDFGTSNTTVYALEEGGEPQPIEFEDRLVPITSERTLRLKENLKEARTFFLPARSQEVPFLTFFHELPAAKNANPSRGIEILKEGHILYVESRQNRADLNAGEVHHDLKWSDTPADRARTKAFLEQIVLQARAEAAANRVSKINWRHSYPSSFSDSQLESIRSTWSSLIGDDDIEKRTESLSTATYFLEAQNAPMVDGSVCIDIGGASADIAIWQDNETLLQTSILLAGQEILLKSIAAKPSRYKPLFDDPDFADLCDDSLSQRELITDLEELLVLKGHEFLDGLDVISGTDAAAHLRQRIALGMSGIFYYAGLLIRHLIEEKKFNRSEGLPSVYFGGNGAKMLHWLDVGAEFQQDSRINDLFEKVLVEASGLKEGFFEVDMTPSEHAKHEVAYGLVVDRNLEAESSESILAGESFTERERSEQKSWQTELTPELLSDGVEVKSQLGHLRQLIETINSFAEDSGDLFDKLPLDDEQLSKTQRRVRGELRELYGRDKEDIDVESIFVLGVKSYLETLRNR